MNDEQFIEDIADRILLHVGPRAILGDWKFKPVCAFDLGSSALVYDNDYYVTILDNEYDLILGNQEWTSQCLEDLEWRLAKYKLIEEGFEKWLHL